MIVEKRADSIELIELDQLIATHSQELTELATKKNQLLAEKQHVDDEVTAADKRVHDLKIKIDGLELELRSLEKNQERIKEKMLAVSSQKEVTSLEHEQETLQQQRDALDEEGLLLLTDYESAQKEAAAKKVEHPKKVQVLQRELEELEDREAHVAKLVAAYREQRIPMVARVPGDFLETYDTMRQRIANPVVPIIKGACSGCYSALRNAEIAKAKTGEFIPCQECYRLMYQLKLEPDDE